MTNPTLSNEIANKAAILWQYDRAPNLIAIVRNLNAVATNAVADFWNYFAEGIMDLENADSFGLEVWGRLLGLPRPKVAVPVAGSSPTEWETTPISDSFFRRLLKGRFYLFGAPASISTYNRYLSLVYGTVQGGTRTRCKVVDHLDMSASFTFPADASDEEAYLIFEHPDLVYSYPAGVRYAKAQERNKSPFPMPSGVIGTEGQSLENFASAFAWAEDEAANGGILSGNVEANYEKPSSRPGYAYVVAIEPGDSKSVVLSGDGQAWIDWGDGVCGYCSLASDYTYSHVYDTSGLYAITVRPEEGLAVATPPAGATKTYELA